MKKYWYAVTEDGDNDWGYGSFDIHEAVIMCAKLTKKDNGPVIVKIDGGYDESGNATTDPIAIEEIYPDIEDIKMCPDKMIVGFIDEADSWDAPYVIESVKYLCDKYDVPMVDNLGEYIDSDEIMIEIKKRME